MRTLRNIIVALAAWLSAGSASADIFVIVNRANPVQNLTNKELVDIYMGRKRVFAGGQYVLAFDQSRDGEVRERFYELLTGMTLSQVNGYWSRLIFTGQMLPPKALPDDRAVLESVRNNPGAIGYVESLPKDDTIKVVLQLKQAS